MKYFIGNNLMPYEGVPNATVEDCKAFLDKQTYFCLDIETGRKYARNEYDERVYQPGLDPYLSRIMMVQVGNLDTRFIIDARCTDISFLIPYLENKNILKIGHNLKFEGKFLLHHLGCRIVNVWDTMIAERVLYNGTRHSYSLAALQLRYLNIKPVESVNLFNELERDKSFEARVRAVIQQAFLTNRYLSDEEAVSIIEQQILRDQYVDKSTRMGFIELGDAPFTQKMVEYGDDDITTPIRIWQEQLKGRLIGEEIYLPHRAFKLENKVTQVLAEAELQGVPFSQTRWMEAYQQAKKLYAKRITALNSYVEAHYPLFCGSIDLFNEKPTCAVNWKSSKEVIKFFKHLQICPKDRSSHTGYMVYTVGAKTLFRKLPNELKGNFFSGKDVEIVDHDTLKLQYLLFKKAEQLITTFGEKWLLNVHPITKRIHTSYNQYMISSRLSSAGPNMQQIPGYKQYRDCFTASCLINADFSGQELRIAAEVHNVQKMIKFFADGDPVFGDDFHSFSATQMFKVIRDDPNYIVPPKGAEGFTKEHGQERNKSKNLTFKLNYGGSAYTVAMDLGIDEEEAEKYIENFFKGLPGMKESFEERKKHAVKYGWVQIDSYTDKRYFFPDFQDMKKAKQEALSYYPEHYDQMSPWERSQVKEELRSIPGYKDAWREYWILRGKLERRALNIPIQGCAASITKLASILLYNYRWENGVQDEFKVPLYVHDELLAECDGKNKEKYAKVIEEKMAKAGTYFCRRVPMPAEAVVSTVWEH